MENKNNWTAQMKALKAGDCFLADRKQYNVLATIRTRLQNESEDKWKVQVKGNNCIVTKRLQK